ncbi:MAG: hypothetical protein ACETWM_21925 [Candidatus Lokiarchaeia archaeon]
MSTFLGLNIPASIGLLSMRSWGRYLASLIGIIFIIVTMISIFSFVFLLVMGGLQIVVGLVLIDVSKLVYFIELLLPLWPLLIINFPILGWVLFLYLETDVKKLFK